MLDFSKVGRSNLVYDFLYGYLALAYRFIYCRKFQVEGRKNVPRKGRGKDGFLVICNHQNGLVDAMGITYAIAPHKPVFIARGDIFKKEFVGKLLRMLHILPAYRKRDGNRNDISCPLLLFRILRSAHFHPKPALPSRGLRRSVRRSLQLWQLRISPHRARRLLFSAWRDREPRAPL